MSKNETLVHDFDLSVLALRSSKFLLILLVISLAMWNFYSHK